MTWLRVGQDGRSGTPFIQTAPPWKEQRMMTTSTRKNNDKNYYEVLEECYMGQDRLGEPELTDTNATQMRRVMMMMPWAAAYNNTNKYHQLHRPDHIDRLMKDNSPPVGFTEEQLDDHIMGIVMAAPGLSM